MYLWNQWLRPLFDISLDSLRMWTDADWPVFVLVLLLNNLRDKIILLKIQSLYATYFSLKNSVFLPSNEVIVITHKLKQFGTFKSSLCVQNSTHTHTHTHTLLSYVLYLSNNPHNHFKNLHVHSSVTSNWPNNSARGVQRKTI